MNLWVKVIKDEKIIKDTVIKNNLALTRQNLEKTLQEVCHFLDQPTPIMLTSHFDNIDKFNFIKFRPADFAETVYFDHLFIESFSN
ncbi:MAG: hypothetical protein RR248_05975 [Clostridia bacterium]